MKTKPKRSPAEAFTLPPLPYPKDALMPHMSPETLEYHHGKHHQAYVDKLNEMIGDTEFKQMSLESIIKKSSGSLFDNAAQVWNHTFFWNCMAPNAGGEPEGKLAKAIEAAFGSFDDFKEKFTEASVTHFGSGWAWLVKNKRGELEVMSTSDARNPMKGDHIPLLTCDVWEHAYYIDYRNSRPDYIDGFWHLVNWDFVAENFAKAE